MTKNTYDIERDKLLEIIGIAIDSINLYPPKNFRSSDLKQFISVYSDFKQGVVNPEPKHKNLKSLAYIKNDTLIYFQEASGDAVTFFWKKLKEKGVNINRVNKFEKILKKNKISNQHEYDYVVDMMIPSLQEGVLTTADMKILNLLIGKFEHSKASPGK